jgi:uncharacterized membrane protein YfcA
LTIGALFLVSILAGFVGAIGGMGGGIVLIPALTWFGVDIKHAIAISILSVIATSSGSAAAYVRDGLTNLRLGMFLEMFTMLGALAGAALAVSLPSRLLFFLLGTVLLCSAALLWARRKEEWKPPDSQDSLSRWLELEGIYLDHATGGAIEYRAIRAHLGGPLMFLAGMVAGLLGIGAGALKVLIHDLIMKLPPKVSTATSNLIIGVTALAGASVYLAQGLLLPGLAVPVILGVVAGAFLGTRVLVKLPNRVVHRVFFFLLLILGTEVIVRGIRKTP